MKMAGRNIKTTATILRHETKEEQEARKAREEKMRNFTPMDFTTYPDGLIQRAYPYFDNIAKNIDGLPVSILDQEAIIRFCNNQAFYYEAVDSVNTIGTIDPDTGKKNPNVDVMNALAKEQNTLSNQLGLNPAARAKLVQQKEEPKQDDPFAMFGN